MQTTRTTISSIRQCVVVQPAGTFAFGSIYLALGDLGVGVYAKKPMRAGDTILRFAGPIIDFARAAAKGDEECYTLQVDQDHYMDLEPPGCFVNHSCDPNACVRAMRLVALREIPSGTEIRYDYSTTMDEDWWTMQCRCGSRLCRHQIKDFKHLDTEAMTRYLRRDMVPPFIAAKYSARNLRPTVSLGGP